VSEIYNFIELTDVMDIFCVACIAYAILWVVARSSSVTALRGAMGLLLGMVLIFAFARFFNLVTLSLLFSSFWFSIVLVFVVVFQVEIRKAIMNLGQYWFVRQLLQRTNTKETIQIICESIYDMSRTKTGALVCIEHHDSLAPYARSGVLVNGEITGELIRTIFTPPSPLHDGAIIIKGDKIRAASCLLPYSQSERFKGKDYGTRHMAAIGMSEELDAIVLVVSEETGRMSICHLGEIRTFNTEDDLETEVLRLLNMPDSEASTDESHESALDDSATAAIVNALENPVNSDKPEEQ